MSELHKGKLVVWKDDKGFGFVRPEVGDKDYFVHISAFKKGMSRRPAVGDVIRYEAAPHPIDQRRIAHAEIEGMKYDTIGIDAGRGREAMHPVLLKVVVSLPILLSFYLIWEAGNPIPLVSYTFMSALAIVYYAADKKHALTNNWRIPEFYLHCFEFMGGWPGALLAQNQFRHKNKKSNYQRIFWAIVILHGVAWLAYLYLDLVVKQ